VESFIDDLVVHGKGLLGLPMEEATFGPTGKESVLEGRFPGVTCSSPDSRPNPSGSRPQYIGIQLESGWNQDAVLLNRPFARGRTTWKGPVVGHGLYS
jgi:hypothetical protein